MSHLFEDTAHVIRWKRPNAQFVIDGANFDGVIRPGSWAGPGDEPTSAELATWVQEFTAANVSHDLEAESRMTDQGVAAMFAVFEATTGSPPTEAEKVTLRDTMKHNLMHGHE
jgi:hypothetical protein